MSNCQIYELRKNELHISTGDVVGIPKCQISSLASDPNGLCILHSRNSEKDYTIFDEALREKLYQEDYDLREIIFPAQVSFENYIFKQEVDFSSAKFLDEAIFIKAKFLDEAIFIKAKFLKDAFFSEVEFLGFSNFFGAEFAGEANLCARFNNGASFNSTTFKGCTEFTEAEFDSGVQFMGARFYDDVDFSWTKFSSNVIFDAAEFHGAVIFDSINFSSEGEPKYTHFYGEFTYLKFGPKAIFQFKDCSLAFVQFEGTDLRCIIFKNVIWYQYGYHRRSAIYDEILLKEKSNKLRREDYARIEESYRYLKLNYGREGDYKHVGDFHYGEMEMHRRASARRRWGSLYSAYWALSGYGERPLRAFIWLLLLIPAWALLVWGLGIEQAGSQNPISYWDTILFIFEKVTFQRPELPKDITWLGKFLSSLSVLLLPGQAALFILALRNRLGRRR